MSFTFSPDWKSKQDVLNYWKAMYEKAGYSITMNGDWALALNSPNSSPAPNSPVDLCFILTRKCDGHWGYKSLSVSGHPNCYSAPPDMVAKVFYLFEKEEFFISWFEQYPQKNAVLCQLNHLQDELF